MLESVVQRCDSRHDLHLSLGGIPARIPRAEVLSPWISGAERDIAILSRVNRPVCFLVEDFTRDEYGRITALLSRRAAQESAGRNSCAASPPAT